MGFESVCPSGTTPAGTQERSQAQNRERAMQLLRAKLFEIEMEKQQSEITARRRAQARATRSI